MISGRHCKTGEKAKPGTKLVFGDGLLTAEVVDVVEEGNRLIQFHYDGILKKFWISWDRCRCRHILRIS